MNATIKPSTSRWTALVGIMREALTDEQRAEFDAEVEARRAERERALALAAARGWRAGRSALGRDLAARKAAKKAGMPAPPPTTPPDFVGRGLAIEPIASESPVSAAPAQPSESRAVCPRCACACVSAGEHPSAAADERPRESSSTTPPQRLLEHAKRYDGSIRLARISVPGTTRERCIAQVPFDDARDAANNSMVYGYGLRTLMSIGAATRRMALADIVEAKVNPHDPIDVVRWGLARRMKERVAGLEWQGKLLESLDALALEVRITRERVSERGVNITARQIRQRPTEPTRPEPSSWDGVAAAIGTLDQLRAGDRAVVAGLLASGDVDVARAWAQENLMHGEGREAT
jgi:hypothetical protein